MAILVPISLSVGPHSSQSPRVTRASNDTSALPHTFSLKPSIIFGSSLKSREIEQAHLRLLVDSRTTTGLRMKASREPPGLTQDLGNNKLETVEETGSRSDLFQNIKHRFLSFKKHTYMKNLEHYEELAKGQAPKFMVIACADSRVCPSAILGFQPGEAFTVRNIANLVPPFEKGPSETNAGLEFSVNTLKVENILVIGHSCCGGIHALMSMEDEGQSSGFIQNWVVLGKNARLKTKAVASNLSFDQQCRHCEKESINRSLLNLLTYPWIEEKVREGVLSLHGGYYDFVDCTFEKWTLDYEECSLKKEDEKISVKDRLFWC
ncbi:beta carbonic anhydrase 5, chloroplastic isoform X1 [Morus notabilis]|uniref:beta carbonic anhydrase 5, chloroplastic isoform X1 n=1 Tax=Morus notabilis TaxID=981085 RepID=UPI000CECF7EC|nr:beta carbonic anhydrase 5, chloroplastic isoform X1 [Morus notabilis]